MSARIRVSLLTVLALALGSSPAYAQWSFEREALKVTPGMLGDGESAVPGLRLASELALRTLEAEGCFPKQGSMALAADAPLTWEADRNPESLKAGFRGGVLVALFCPPEAVAGEPPPLEPPGRWGFLEIAAEASLETVQEMEDADLTLGTTLAYEHDQDRLWFLPAFTASFGFVDCLACTLPEGEDSWARRMDLEAAWSIPLRALMPQPLDGLRLRATGRYFAADGMGEALKEVREDIGTWGALELAYQFRNPGLFQEVHAGWRGGELPQRLVEQDAWTVGVTVVF